MTSAAERRQKLLEEAIQVVCKDRAQSYGDAEDNFATIAQFWDLYFASRPLGCGKLASKDVAIMMILFKISRLTANPAHRDTWLDIAGYAACGGGIATGEQSESTSSSLDALPQYEHIPAEAAELVAALASGQSTGSTP